MNEPNPDKVKIGIIGGFYGVGKTTTIIQMAKKLSQESKRVAVISNDKGAINVDGELIKKLGFAAEEIVGGCVCFYLSYLRYVINKLTQTRFVPDILFLEPVAYFLPSKLYADLRREFGETLDLAPATILVDGPQLLYSQVHTGSLPFIESRQIEDAEVVVINKMDLVRPDNLPVVETIIRRINPTAKLLMMSAKTGLGFDELSRIVLHGKHEILPSVTMNVFKGFARSVTEIGERAEQYAIAAENRLIGADMEDFLRDLLRGIAERMLVAGGEVNHVKALIADESSFLKASLVALDQEVDFVGDVESLSKGRIVVNAIGRGLPDDFLYHLITETFQQVGPKYAVKFVDIP